MAPDHLTPDAGVSCSPASLPCVQQTSASLDQLKPLATQQLLHVHPSFNAFTPVLFSFHITAHQIVQRPFANCLSISCFQHSVEGFKSGRTKNVVGAVINAAAFVVIYSLLKWSLKLSRLNKTMVSHQPIWSSGTYAQQHSGFNQQQYYRYLCFQSLAYPL